LFIAVRFYTIFNKIFVMVHFLSFLNIYAKNPYATLSLSVKLCCSTHITNIHTPLFDLPSFAKQFTSQMPRNETSSTANHCTSYSRKRHGETDCSAPQRGRCALRGARQREAPQLLSAYSDPLLTLTRFILVRVFVQMGYKTCYCKHI
jgi:hypothetical protein